MSCNCATDEYLNRLYKELGQKRASTKNMKPMEKFSYRMKRVLLSLNVLLLMPFIVLYVLYVSIFGDGKISFTNFFGLKPISVEEYVRKQQRVQNKD